MIKKKVEKFQKVIGTNDNRYLGNLGCHHSWVILLASRNCESKPWKFKPIWVKFLTEDRRISEDLHQIIETKIEPNCCRTRTAITVNDDMIYHDG